MALAESDFAKDANAGSHDGDLILGDDFVAPRGEASRELASRRQRRSILSLWRSPLARKIITLNLIALGVMAAGFLYSNFAERTLAAQRAEAMVNEVGLIANVLEAQLPGLDDVSVPSGAFDLQAILDRLNLRNGAEVFVFDSGARLIRQAVGVDPDAALPFDPAAGETGLMAKLGERLSTSFRPRLLGDIPVEEQLRGLVKDAVTQSTGFSTQIESLSGRLFTAGAPIFVDGKQVGMVALTSAAGEIDELAATELERVLRMFIIAALVSVGLSLILASTIANPLADLSAAAELGRDRNTRNVNPGKVRIPDLTARPDEIGQLSGALRSMVAALYTRIEGNEQFAADVAHEIKNPLASLRSAVGTLRMVKREDQREKLLDVIDHDVRRLDRLVSDISNASRLDAELVKEEEEGFDLLHMLGNLGQFLGEDARSKGIEFILDLPEEPIDILGLEARLAQVFVNLITNAISFCEDGDAIRVWVRRRANRVLVVVEDTGPGIPDSALSKIFKRFYSERPQEHFGNNSGLGLAISKQIVEAHGGVIWAENIRPTDADLTSEPLGARFVVGLPV